MECVLVPSVGGFHGFCFPFVCLFPCSWVGPIDLLLRDLIVCRCHPVGGGPPYLNVNAGSMTIKKKKKKKIQCTMNLKVLKSTCYMLI